MVKQIFVNLPIKDLNRSVEFFTGLGFTFNPEFTDDKATCMIIGENIFAMLLTEEFFKTFLATTEVADATRVTEVLTALALESRAEVDMMMERALAAGGSEPRPAEDHGWMYSRAFQDLDGHIWEPFYADVAARTQESE